MESEVSFRWTSHEDNIKLNPIIQSVIYTGHLSRSQKIAGVELTNNKDKYSVVSTYSALLHSCPEIPEIFCIHECHRVNLSVMWYVIRHLFCFDMYLSRFFSHKHMSSPCILGYGSQLTDRKPHYCIIPIRNSSPIRNLRLVQFRDHLTRLNYHNHKFGYR